MRLRKPLSLLLILSFLLCGIAEADTRRASRATDDPVASELRFALVIGNSADKNTRPLKNPVNDAKQGPGC